MCAVIRQREVCGTISVGRDIRTPISASQPDRWSVPTTTAISYTYSTRVDEIKYKIILRRILSSKTPPLSRYGLYYYRRRRFQYLSVWPAAVVENPWSKQQHHCNTTAAAVIIKHYTQILSFEAINMLIVIVEIRHAVRSVVKHFRDQLQSLLCRRLRAALFEYVSEKW